MLWTSEKLVSQEEFFWFPTKITQISWAKDFPAQGTCPPFPFIPVRETEHSPPHPHFPLSFTAHTSSSVFSYQYSLPLLIFFNPCSVTSEKFFFFPSFFILPSFPAIYSRFHSFLATHTSLGNSLSYHINFPHSIFFQLANILLQISIVKKTKKKRIFFIPLPVPIAMPITVKCFKLDLFYLQLFSFYFCFKAISTRILTSSFWWNCCTCVWWLQWW